MEAVSPVVRVVGALQAWAEQPKVRTALLAIHELATVDSRLQGYRERWEQKGIPISVKEAERTLRCLGYATFNEPVEPSQYLAYKLENTSSEEMIARYIEHAESKVFYWDALIAYKESHGGDVLPMLSEWPPKGAKRPNGRGRPPQWKFRNEILIPKAIQKLEGCGLPVTSADGSSIAAAAARVFGLSARNVATIWESTPNRSGKHSRQRYSNQPCHMCGHPKVPMWRAQRIDFRCDHCQWPRAVVAVRSAPCRAVRIIVWSHKEGADETELPLASNVCPVSKVGACYDSDSQSARRKKEAKTSLTCRSMPS